MRHGPGTPAATTGQLIRAVGDVLSLPHRTVVTALYLYWRLQLATEEEGAGEGAAWTQEVSMQMEEGRAEACDHISQQAGRVRSALMP